MADLREIYRAANTIDVQLLQQRLKDHGLHTVIQGENLAATLGVGIASFVVPCRLLVRSDEYDEAIAVIAVLRARDRALHDAAPPDCGACGEPWEPGFEVCWNCEAPLPK